MAKFIMANRRAGKFQETEKRASRASLDLAFAESLEESVTVLGDTRPDDDQGRRIIKFEASAEEVANKVRDLPPDVIIEPEILHYPLAGPRFHSSWLPFVAGAQPLDAGAGGVMDGTSMASPVVCGALAAILSADQAYLSLPRNVARSEQARAILRALCRDLRLAARYQGRGIPRVF